MRSAGNTSSGLILFALVALTASAGFVRLGIWQLERHREVRAANATKAERLAREPVRLDPSMLRGDSTEALIGRRVEVRGRWETDREVVIRSRARAGTPGIHVVTPLRLDDVADDPADGPSSILVLRGWQSSVDAVRRGSASADSGADGREHLLALVRESRTGRGAPMVRLGGDDGVPSYAAIDVELISGGREESAPFFLQLLPAEGGLQDRPGEPIPVPLPTLEGGSHMSYAIQWFSFALITIVGSIAFLRRESGSRGLRAPE